MMKPIQKNKLVVCIQAFFIVTILLVTGCSTDTPSQNQEPVQNLSPKQVLDDLIAGNKRFLSNSPLHRNDLQIKGAEAAKLGQSPKIVILACMDSRSIPEIVFDQSVGDIFTLRVAGNIVNKAMVGSIEYATKYAGAKLIVVLGHTKCGAVEAACQGIRDGNLSAIIDVIEPAVQDVSSQSEKNCDDNAFVTKLARQNVYNMMQLILKESPVVADMIARKELAIVGGMHDLRSGVVNFDFIDQSL